MHRFLTPVVNALVAAALLWCGLANPPFEAGFRSGLQATPAANQQTLTLQTETGDIVASLRLRFHDASLSTTDIHADINGRPLVVTPAVTPDQQGWIDILARDPATGNSGAFHWAGHEAVTLSTTASGRVIDLADWELFTGDGRDSKWLARKRLIWKFSAVVLAALSLIIGIAALKPDRPVITEQLCIEYIVNQIVGRNDDETSDLRRFLRMIVIEGADVAEGLQAVRRNPATMTGKQFFFRARSLFVHRLDTFITRLAFESSRLKRL